MTGPSCSCTGAEGKVGRSMRWTPAVLVALALLLASCAAPIVAPSPTASATPGPTVAGLVLPSGCKYVGTATVQIDSTSWAFDCGAAANADARGIIRPALIQSGWTFCGGAGGRDVYARGTMSMYVENPGSAPGALPNLMLTNQRVGNCPSS